MAKQSKLGIRPVYSTKDPAGNPATKGEEFCELTRTNNEKFEDAIEKKADENNASGKVVRTGDGTIPTIDLSPYAKHGGSTKTIKQVEDDVAKKADENNTAGKVVRTGDGTIPAIDLSPYAKHGGSTKTIKQVEDDVAKKADGCRLTDENKLQLTSGSADIGTPLELPTGILNLSYKMNKEYEDSLTARKSVKSTDRILGQVITYKLNDGTWVLDQFIGESVASWESEGSWVNYALMRDLSPILSEMEGVRAQLAGLDSTVKSKVDGGYTEDLDDSTLELVMTSNGTEVARIQLPKGGGGGGGPAGVLMRMQAVGSTSLVVGEGSDALVKYNWTSIDQQTSSPTGNGTVFITVNGIPVYSGEVPQGENQYNVKNSLNMGANSVRVRVTDGWNNVRNITYNVQKASLVLTSTFADDVIYKTIPIAFRYTPIGSGEKKIRFWLNGTELTPEVTTASGKQLTKNLTNLSAGANSIKVVAESNIEGSQLISNELYYEFIFADASIAGPVITISYQGKPVPQFGIINIPYLVYDPNKLNADVELYIDGLLKQKLSVPRARQYWSYAAYEQGVFNMEIRCGGVRKSVNVEVVASEYDIAEEKGDLIYKASAIGKSNNAEDKASWKYGAYDAVFKNFLWGEDGWHKDTKGDNHLRLVGDAAVSIGINPFNNAVLTEGMTLTIEYATENVADSTVVVASCMFNGIGIEITPTSVKIRSSQSILEARLNSATKTSISFSVQKSVSNRLLLLFIDGIMSGALQYPTSDNFTQSTPQGLTLSTGNRGCTAMFYAVRWYRNDLNYDQILANYIYDIEMLDEKIAVYDRNNVIDDYGTIDYNKALEDIPCLTIVGDLPTYKGDKKVCTIVYEDRQKPLLSFIADNVQNDVQGTSSQFYPRKNFKFKLKDGLTLSESGIKQSKYALDAGQIPVDVFCLKTQFIESSCSHDTGLAIVADEVLRDINYKTKPQLADDKVRTTIYGKPILVFHKKTASDQAEFIGKYSLNNDKSTAETFGFTPGCESWEFLNNTSERSLFNSAEFSGTDWKNDFDPRYPEDVWDPTNMKKVFEWVLSCKGNPSKFKAECANHFKVDWLLFYCLWTEATASVDARAKNQFLTTFGEKGPTGQLLWLFILYDLKTTLGINNEGHAQFDFNVESQDMFGSGHVWNGWNSVLWTLVESAYKTELTALYQNLRQRGVFSPVVMLSNLQDKIVSKWSENVYNQDGFYKYIEILIKENNGAFLYALQGSRSRHRIWWIENRFAYMDGKYTAGDYKNDFATMRIYTPKTWTAVEPNANFDLAITRHSYLQVKYGSYFTTPIRGFAGNEYRITAPNSTFNDTETIIYGISTIKSLGDLAPKYPGTVDITKAIALEELKVGSLDPGYKNENLTVLHTGSNEMLRTVNVANCPNLRQSLDLSKCYSLERVEARGSGITGISLPESGVLKELRLPASFSALYLKNQSLLTTLTLEDYVNLNTVVIDNVPNVDGYTIVKHCVEAIDSKLSKVRLTKINATDTTHKTLRALLLMTGEDDNGMPTNDAYITGKIHVETISRVVLEEAREKYPELTITYNMVLDFIEFEDPIVKALCVAKWDTNKDGEISSDEVRYANVPIGMFTGTGAKKFNELRYWGGSTSVINDCSTLTDLSVVLGSVAIYGLPALKNLTVYSPGDPIETAPKFGYDTVRDCYSIEKFILTGRYFETAQGGMILAKQIINGVESARFRLPLRGYSKITVDEKLHMTVADSTEDKYSWGRDLKELVFKNLYDVTLPNFPNLEKVTISGTSDSANNNFTLDTTASALQELVINDQSGNNLSKLILNSGVRRLTFVNVKCNSTAGSIFVINHGQANMDYVDLPATYKPLSIQLISTVYGSPFQVGAKLIIRSNSFIPCTSLGYAYNNIIASLQGIYVPDGIVNVYKAASNWSILAHKFFPISELPNI